MMDPNSALDKLLLLAEQIQTGDQEYTAWMANYAIEMAKLVKDLDTWMNNGGHRPTRWADKGVNLELGGCDTKLASSLDNIRNLLKDKKLVLPAVTPQVVIAVPVFGKDHIVAALATHVAISADPVEATDQLYYMLKQTIESIPSS